MSGAYCELEKAAGAEPFETRNHRRLAHVRDSRDTGDTYLSDSALPVPRGREGAKNCKICASFGLMREAVWNGEKARARAHLSMAPSGDGRVIRRSPAAGEWVKPMPGETLAAPLAQVPGAGERFCVGGSQCGPGGARRIEADRPPAVKAMRLTGLDQAARFGFVDESIGGLGRRRDRLVQPPFFFDTHSIQGAACRAATGSKTAKLGGVPRGNETLAQDAKDLALRNKYTSTNVEHGEPAGSRPITEGLLASAEHRCCLAEREFTIVDTYLRFLFDDHWEPSTSSC